MEKEELLNSLKNGLNQQIISRDEVLSIVNGANGYNAQAVQSHLAGNDAETLKKHINFSEALYYIGGFIVFLGIVIMVVQNWDSLNAVSRILITLGSGLAAYVTGIFLSRTRSAEKVSTAFFLISALVLPVGLMVVFDNAGFEVDGSGVQSWISFLLTSFFLISYFFKKSNEFLLFSIIFGTWFYFGFCDYLFAARTEHGLEYLTLAIGAAYAFLAHYFSATEDKKPLCGFLYGFGAIFFLGAALSLGGYSPTQNIFWEIIFPGLVFGVLYLGTFLKVRSFLILSVLFLMIYIIKITTEYFTEGLGWPFSLVIMGLAVIGLGYLAVYLNRKYINQANL